MKASTTLCIAALLALAACDHHDAEAPPAPEPAASDNSAFLEGGQRAEAAASEAGVASAPAPHADRGPPPQVPPIVRDGLRYAQGDNERDPGLPQSSGMLVVSDDFSGKRLWTLAVYPEDARRAPDGRWVLFRSMAFDPDGRLRVVNEDDQAFVVDVRRRTSTPAGSK
ncbi:MAG: hypothetical protein JF586_18155 [Burkholderiales bacterium]|nr:hypothetical protein [Burkholderiales bacterium]